MKIISNITNTINEYTIDYENGIYCDVVTVNNNLEKWAFYRINAKIKTSLFYVDDISLLLNSHWSDHWTLFGCQEKKAITLEKLESFTEFDKLFYIGGHTDGIVCDCFGRKLSSIEYIDEIHSHIYHNITTKKQTDEIIEKCKNIDWVISCEVVKIPYYNRKDEDNEDEQSVYLKVKLPQDLLDSVYEETKSQYFDDKMKKWVMNYILNS